MGTFYLLYLFISTKTGKRKDSTKCLINYVVFLDSHSFILFKDTHQHNRMMFTSMIQRENPWKYSNQNIQARFSGRTSRINRFCFFF